MQGLMVDYPLTIDRILEHANRIYPHKQIATKLPDGTLHRYTYADLYRRVKQLANVLGSLGVKPGDRVGTFAWNTYQHLELYYAIPCSGAVCHPLNIRLFPEQLAYIINHAEDRVIFVDATLLPAFEQVADLVDCVEHVVLFNAGEDQKTDLPNISLYETWMAGADDAYEWAVTDENRAMGLCYTSGTTGNPKGALFSHRSMVLHTFGGNQANAIGLVETDVVLPVVPQFHAMAWGLPYACALAGTDIVMPGPHLKPDALALLIATERVTLAGGVPTVWTELYQELKVHSRDISCIRTLLVGGSAMPRTLIEAYEKELGVSVLHAWGMTELSPLGTVSRLQSNHRDLPDSEKWDVKAKQGNAAAGVEMRIVDEAGDEVPWDGETVGEVQVRGAWVVKGYYKLNSDPEHFTPDGWFRTGDVGAIDKYGYLTLTDRTKDLIKSGGEWISSVELENALMAHAGVVEAAAIAIPDERWGERPLAVVVLTPDTGEVTVEALREYLALKVTRFWLPDHIVFVEEIPKTSVGKFDKKIIRQQYAEGRLG